MIIESSSDYKKVFQHDLTTPEFFNATAGEIGRKNPDNEEAVLFSILGQLEKFRSPGGQFYLKICFPDLTIGVDGGKCNEWSQSSNPFTETTITKQFFMIL